jgi:hypothetical protein
MNQLIHGNQSDGLDLVAKPISEAAPRAKPKGQRRDAVFKTLMEMKLNEGLKLNIKYFAAVQYVYQFRVMYGRELRYIVRPTETMGWVKIWRVR